ncbi:hypothetical protein ACLOJK_037605 [Asimina triloba]
MEGDDELEAIGETNMRPLRFGREAAAAAAPSSSSLISTAALIGVSFFFVSLIPLVGVYVSICPSHPPRLSLRLPRPLHRHLLLLHLPRPLRRRLLLPPSFVPLVGFSMSLLPFPFLETLSVETYIVIVCRNPIISFGSVSFDLLSKPCRLRIPVCRNPIIVYCWISLRNLGGWISLPSSSIMLTLAIVFELQPICSAAASLRDHSLQPKENDYS